MRYSVSSRAAALAQALHAGQKYGNRPYVCHLIDVTGVLAQYGFVLDQEMMAAGWLHDAIEDTPATRETIDKLISAAVANLVWGVTDEPGANRKERKAATYPKIRKDPRCVALKLADRIANVRACIQERRVTLNPYGSLDMYREEYPEFRAALWREGEWVDMWEELDRELGGGK